jgi:ABC-type transport system substrate-binding protein
MCANAVSTERLDIPAQPGPSVCGGRIVVAIAQHPRHDVSTLTRNRDYWKSGRPYLDGIEYTVIRNASTWILALGAHQFDRTGPGFVPISLLKEIKNQASEMSCEIASWNTGRTAIVNRCRRLTTPS